jgi:putative spermidine/putrescine transport system ATP-binding protein
MARLELAGITKRYGEVTAADDLSLDVADGEFVVLLGPSGCGKTTTLRIIAGFIEPTSGTVRLGGRDVTVLPPWKRNAGLVFQSYALFPHMTVGENVAFGLEMRKVPKAEMAPRIAEALRLVRLDHLSGRLPRQLSGGQQQRVALARALVFHPDVLLLDEPLSNLDAKLRQDVRVEIRELQRKLGLTTVMVTHDQEEALTMADRLVVMSEGRIRQIGTQQDLYERPSDRFVADFVGRSTFIDGRMEGPGRFVSAGGLTVACDSTATGAASLALRPERLALLAATVPVIGERSDAVLRTATGERSDAVLRTATGERSDAVLRTATGERSDAVPGTAMDNSFPGQVEFISYLGSQVDLHVRLSPKERVIVQIQNRPEQPLPVIGEEVRVGWSKSTGRVFSA